MNANIRRSACFIRRSASAPRARDALSASPGTKRSIPSPKSLSANRRAIRPGSDPALQLRGHDGSAQRQRYGPAVFSSPGRIAPGSDDLFGRRRRRSAATLGFRYGTEPEQFPHAKLIIAWAANIHGTNVHLWPFIVEARRNGAKLYVIDPVQTRTAALADRTCGSTRKRSRAGSRPDARNHRRKTARRAITSRNTPNGFELSPSGCAPMIRNAWPRSPGSPRKTSCSSPANTRPSRPAAIRANYGVQRSERGGSAVRAIAALPALTGSWREMGGGLQLSTSQAFQFNRTALEMPELQMRSPLGREARMVNMSRAGHRP